MLRSALLRLLNTPLFFNRLLITTTVAFIMAEKKRKRVAEDENHPRKKTAVSEDAQTIKVNHIADTDGLGPIIGISDSFCHLSKG